MGEKPSQPRYEFAKGRLTAEEALAQLVAATGKPPEEILAAIQPLGMPNLGVGVDWASDSYNLEREVGHANAVATAQYIIVRVPTQNAAGERQDMTGVQRSHLIDTEADGLACQSFEDFDGASEWLMDNVATAMDLTAIDWSQTALAPIKFED